MVVFASYLVLPAVVNTVTPLVTYGNTVQAASTKYASELSFIKSNPQVIALAPDLAAIQDHPAIFAGLAANPNSPALQAAALKAVGPATFASIARNQAAITNLITQHPAQLAAVGERQQRPQLPDPLETWTFGRNTPPATTGSQWKTWYWICFGGVIFFLLTVPLMKGRWSPKAAREDEEAHEAMVQAELAKLARATV